MAFGLAWPGRAAAQQAGPEDVVRAHFDAITAENYTGADDYFSTAFLRAFKADVSKLNYYYLARQAQLAAGYEITETAQLEDPGRETMLVVVEFGPIDPTAFVTATERMHYYLIHEKAEAGAPLRDAQGMAWRIDIFDALRFDSLADARRRPYLYTRDSWDDDASRELKSRQGVYRIYLALEAFKAEKGQYPLRLLGGANRRDELIAGGYLKDSYPACGFGDGPMEEYGVDRNHAGDFGYYSIDRDGDGQREGFWLLLHGKDQPGFYYTDRDIIYIINDSYAPNQRELAEQFAQFWQAQRRETLQLRDVAWEQGLDLQPSGVASAAADALHRLEQTAASPEPLRPAFPGVIAPREDEEPDRALGPSPEATTSLEAGAAPQQRVEPEQQALAQAGAVDGQGDGAYVELASSVARQLAAIAQRLRPTAGAPPAGLPAPAGDFAVHSYGF